MAIGAFFLLSAASWMALSYGSLFLENRGMTEKRDVCSTQDCQERARVILSYVDQEGNPCEDFYSYVCGKHLKSRTEEDVYNEFDQLQNKTNMAIEDIINNYPNITEAKNADEKVMMMYQSCIHSPVTEEQELEAIKEILEKQGYGSWPLLGKEKSTQKKFQNLKELLLATSLQHLLHVHVDSDPFNRRNHIIWMSTESPTLSPLPLHITGNSSRNNTLQIRALEEVLRMTARHLRPNASEEDLEALAKDAIRIEAKLHWTKPASLLSRRRTIRQAEESLPSFPVLELLNGLMHDVNITLRYDDFIYSDKVDHLENSVRYLLSEDINSLYNYMGLCRAVHLLNFSSTTYQQKTAQIYKDHQIDTPEYSRVEVCRKLLKKVPTVITRLYLLQKFDFANKVAARSVVNSIGRMYNRNLQLVPWMDRATRLAALDKLRKLKPVLGYSDAIMNNTTIGSRYRLLENIEKYSPFSKMLYWFEKNVVELNLLRIKGTNASVDEVQYEVVNPWYSYLENEIVIPAGMLQGILFNTGLPTYLNLGLLGFTAGHEITHGFDNRGRKYNGLGYLSHWWTNHTEQEFNDRANCFTGQYGKILEPLTNRTLLGRYILAENIADNVGIRVALKVFRELEKREPYVALPGLEQFTSEQLFFISFAMPWCARLSKHRMNSFISFNRHAPPPYRVNVPLKNMEEFSAAFRCKKGSAMRLPDQERCVLW